MKKTLVVFALLLACVGTSVASVFKLPSLNADTVLDIKSPSCYLADYESGSVMFEKNAEARRPIASMVKIMTLLLSFEHIENGQMTFEDKLTVSENAAGMGGSQAFLDANSQYSVDELIKSITIASANDACVVMAETIAGSVEGFVAKMNEKASALGMTNTNFVNCTGLPADNQYSCAKDVFAMTHELISHKEYFNYSTVWMYNLEHPTGRLTELTNTHKLVKFYEGCDGGKTGFTNEAMFCLSATAKRNGMRLISIVIGANDSKVRNAEVSKLFNYGFSNYESKQVVFSENALDERAKVTKGISEDVGLKPAENFSVFSKKGGSGNIEKNIIIAKVKAPVKIGDVVGKLTLTRDGEIIKEIDLVSTEKVRAKTYVDSLKGIAENW